MKNADNQLNNLEVIFCPNNLSTYLSLKFTRNYNDEEFGFLIDYDFAARKDYYQICRLSDKKYYNLSYFNTGGISFSVMYKHKKTIYGNVRSEILWGIHNYNQWLNDACWNYSKPMYKFFCRTLQLGYKEVSKQIFNVPLHKIPRFHKSILNNGI